jgi:16S rRNA U516 pseudouridylate synthase RsuA-like enzyme
MSRERSERAGAAPHDKREEATLAITIREGRNRQVRNMCDAIGHPVTHLKRVAIGPLRDPKLKVGQWRELTAQEVERLRKAAALTERQGRGGRRDQHQNVGSRDRNR